MKLTLGFSTCPNDTFIFDAMIHGKVDTEGLSFDIVMEDVEQLNKRVTESCIDISKLSFHAYAHATQNYILLTSGSALGRKNGPLLISRQKIYPDEVNSIKVAVPGINTTANMLFSIEYPDARDKKVYLFSDIEEAVLGGEVDAGVIIHESRFTYEQKGLRKIVDLGESWEKKSGYPVPLGGIAIRRAIDEDIRIKVNRVLKRSVLYALENPNTAYDFVKKYAQELDDHVILQHIQLYVNNYTIEMNDEAKEAIRYLYKIAFERGVIKLISDDIFI
ncbi:MAG: 1,4-dihydroxy-6-naphthoate synthase [Prolixibacteraceae bacterium]|jgi:1,4-dihydroxy-6-naphthoate synthase|nr:1,4-dihydroxy-6-naphthoate synthase [Prolixibacteraceae bacterium]MDD4754503.1 1,4-dihydroxy-6-naphthoate synthase [Prolixibacteraceae bacterium]